MQDISYEDLVASAKAGCLLSWMRRGHDEFPEKSMVVSQTTSMSYRQGYHLALDLVAFFQKACGQEPVIAVSVHNIVEFPSIVAAAQSLGATMVLLPPSSSKETLANAERMFSPSLLITDSRSHCIAARSDGLEAQVLTSGFKFGQFACLQQLEASDRGACPVDASLVSRSRFALFSSGSTGKPKAIINRASSFGINGTYLLEALHVTKHDILYVPVPYFHVYGMLGVSAALNAGLTLVSSEHYRPTYSMSLIQRYNVTLYFGVSTMFLRELNLVDGAVNPTPKLRAVLSAGAPMSQRGISAYEAKFGCRLIQAYGMTETAATVTVSDLYDPEDVRASTVGRPVGGAQVKIDPANSEIMCKTPQLAVGVMHEDGLWPLKLDDGWFRTGDLGHFEGKDLVIDGRLKDMIIRGGINIYPAEVEAVYDQVESIVNCRLVGYPDSELGERTCLFVVGTDECPGEDMLRAFAKGKVERAKIPDIVVEVDTMPKLANGKLDGKRLSAMALEAGKERGLC